MDSPTNVMVVDLGSFSCKCAVVDRFKSHIKTATIESVVALVSKYEIVKGMKRGNKCGWKHEGCGYGIGNSIPGGSSD